MLNGLKATCLTINVLNGRFFRSLISFGEWILLKSDKIYKLYKIQILEVTGQVIRAKSWNQVLSHQLKYLVKMGHFSVKQSKKKSR